MALFRFRVENHSVLVPLPCVVTGHRRMSWLRALHPVRKGIVQRTPAKSLPHRLLPDFVEMNETPEVEAVVRAGGGTQLI